MVNILELTDPAELTFLARTLPEPIENSLESILPNRTINGRKTQTVRGTRKTFKAQYRSYNAESPIGQRDGGLTLSEIILPALSEKLPLDEELIFRLHEASSDILVGRVRDQVFDDIANLVTSLRNRVEEARGQLLSTGKITIDENGFVAEADFGLAADHKVTPGALWSAVGATPLTNEIAWTRKVKNDAQAVVTKATTSERVYFELLKSVEYRTAFWQRDAAVTPTLNPEQLNQVRASFGLPPLNIYDGFVPNNTGGVQRVIADDLFILTTDTVGETQWGTTAEALELAGSNAVDFTASDAPGITVNQWKTPDSVNVWTKASSVVMPVAGDIAGLLVADVL